MNAKALPGSIDFSLCGVSPNRDTHRLKSMLPEQGLLKRTGSADGLESAHSAAAAWHLRSFPLLLGNLRDQRFGRK